MLTAFNQNWRTTNLAHSLALANTVTTGVSFTTPSGAIRNSQIWGSAGFRGFGPVMTFPGAGMDGLGQMPLNYQRAGFFGVGCGCNCSPGMGDFIPSNAFAGIPWWLVGAGALLLFVAMGRGR